MRPTSQKGYSAMIANSQNNVNVIAGGLVAVSMALGFALGWYEHKRETRRRAYLARRARDQRQGIR